MTTYYEINKDKIKERVKARWYAKKEELKEKQRIYSATPEAKALQRQRDLRWRRKSFENYMWRSLKNRCKQETKDFNLDLEDIIIPEYCPYLQVPITKILGEGRKQPYNPSVDRIDPTKGYIKGNIQIISEKANRMKQDASKEELLAFAQSILNMYGEKND